jgi:hypothetical protein
MCHQIQRDTDKARSTDEKQFRAISAGPTGLASPGRGMSSISAHLERHRADALWLL